MLKQISAIIVAGGQSSRFGGSLPKVYHPLSGRPVLTHALAAFVTHPEVKAIQTVIRPEDLDWYEAAIDFLPQEKILSPVFGGSTRQQSVANGLQALNDLSPSFVLIHDAARPLVSRAVIDRVLTALNEYPAVIPALPIHDTIKRAEKQPGWQVKETVERENLWLAQTPQGFHFSEISRAHSQHRETHASDDAGLCELAGIPVGIVEGEADNIKLTTPDDLKRITAMITPPLVRTGMGFDVHAFGPGKRLMLGGVEIPFDKALVGHSDADVALHAITDALLGACALGDIGLHFPPHDEAYRNIDSAVLLSNTASLLRERGWEIMNVDLTLICEQPKITAHRAAMIEKIAQTLDLKVDQVSVKATTTEKLGFTGREEGIAAQAVATVSYTGSSEWDNG